MMRVIEGLVFVSLATGLHVGIWSAAPDQHGTSSSGSIGPAIMNVAAAAQSQLVQIWQSPPSAADATPDLIAPDPVQPTPNPVSINLSRPKSPSGPRLPATRSAPVPAALPRLEPIPAQPRARASASAPAQSPAPPSNLSADGVMPDVTPRPEKTQPKRPPDPEADSVAKADTTPPIAPRPKPVSNPGAATPPQGGGTTPAKSAGKAGADSTQSESNAARNALQAQWGSRIQRKVHRRLLYPRGASGAGLVRVGLTIDRNGALTGLRILQSSGVSAFDQAALNAVQRAGPFPSAPPELTQTHYDFRLSLSFQP